MTPKETILHMTVGLSLVPRPTSQLRIDYITATHPQLRCGSGYETTLGWLNTYTRWAGLLFTQWPYLLLRRTPQEPEDVLYVVSSLLVPAVIAAVPLATATYGVSPIRGCYTATYTFTTTAMHHHALIERFALWDAPAIVILLTAPAAMVVVIIRLTKQVCWRLNYEAITESDGFWKTLKLLLPLAALPILFSHPRVHFSYL